LSGYGNISGVNPASGIDVGPEVRARDRLKRLLPDERDISRIHSLARIHISQEHAHWNGNVTGIHPVIYSQ
jgi:hypothetical protein